MPRDLTLGGQRIADDSPAYVIAEIGHNHGGSLEVACDMIHMAADAGADAVKLQKRDNGYLYSRAMLAQPYENQNSYGPTYGAHRDALELNVLGYRDCQDAARQHNVAFIATAFDEPSADMLAGLHVHAIKIHSGGLTDEPLLKHVAGLCTPVILSTGGGTDIDIARAVNIVAPRVPLALLHATAAYPVRDYAELNVRCITTLRERYPELVIGWSSHDPGAAMALVAYSLGARIIEKHVTLNRTAKGTDHAWSLDPPKLKRLCADLKDAHVALGDGVKRVYESERAPIAKMRRTFINGRMQIGTAEEQVEHAH